MSSRLPPFFWSQNSIWCSFAIVSSRFGGPPIGIVGSSHESKKA